MSFGETVRAAPEGHVDELRTIALLDEFVRRVALCVDYADATRTGLEALDDLFGFAQSILLVADERGDRLFAVASNGYPASAAGAEVAIGAGVIGTAAERRRVVCVPNVARGRSMQAAIQQTVERSGIEPPGAEIPLPGLDSAQSAAAVPLVVHGELGGVLYLESGRPGDFGPGNERLLRIVGGHLAAVLAVLQGDRHEGDSRDPEVHALSSERSRAPSSTTRRMTAFSSTMPIWSRASRAGSCGSCCASTTPMAGRRSRTGSCGWMRSLGLPPGNDNLEARLLVLRKRLAAMDSD